MVQEGDIFKSYPIIVDNVPYLWYTVYLMAEQEPMQTADVPRESLSRRIIKRIDRYTHPVSTEARDQLQLIKDVLPEGALVQTLESVEPQFRHAMRRRDQHSVFWNLFSTGVRLGLGTGFLYNTGRSLRGHQWLNSALNAGLGLWFTMTGVNNPSMAGYYDRNRVQQESFLLQTYYNTEVGRNASMGRGFGESESLTNQVDRIVRAITLGDIPTVSGVRPH